MKIYQKFVNKHNVMLRRSMNWARTHQAQGGSGYIENPLTSMLWKARAVLSMVKSDNFQLFRYDMCPCGTQYKKQTRLLLLGPLDSMGVVQNLFGAAACSRTLRQHLSLPALWMESFAHLQRKFIRRLLPIIWQHQI